MTQRRIYLALINMLLLGTLIALPSPQVWATQPQEQVTISFQNKDKDKDKGKDKNNKPEKSPNQNFDNQDMLKQPRFIQKVPKQNPEPNPPPKNDPPKDKKKG